jgi:hypothetical protein
MDDAVDIICASGAIGAADVLELRRTLYNDGQISRDEAEQIFRLDQNCADKDPTWAAFYVEALTDFFVWQANPRGYVSDALAEILERAIVHDGRIDQMTELELLVNIVSRATSCPEKLAVHVLQAVKESIVSPKTAAYGSNRPPATATAADAALIRNVIHAPGGDGSIAVTRREAEILFDLNDVLDDENKGPEWDDVFVKGIACHLTSPMPEPMKMTADAELKRQKWLAEKPAFGTTLRGMGAALGRLDVPFAEAWRDVDPGGVQRARDEREAEEVRLRESYSRQGIHREEAAWLKDRLSTDGEIKENEKSLLKFIKDIAPEIDPILEPMLQKAGL